jgi:hypothetical protein
MNLARSLRYLPAALVVCGATLNAQSGFIQGTVRSDAGTTLSGMTVAAYNTAGALATTSITDGTGSYTLSLPPATYRVLAYDLEGNWATSFYNDAGSFDTSATIDVTPGSTRTGIDFRLRPGLRIHGVVVTSSNTPLQGMVVSAYNLDGTRRGFQTTNALGEFALTVPAGEYKVVAWDDALVFAPEFYSNAKSFGTASTVRVSAHVFGITFSLDPGAKASGVVTASKTGQPLSGINVSAFDAATGELIAYVTTRAGGEFLLALPAGRYKFGATDPAEKYLAEFSANAPSFAAAASFDLPAGATRVGIDFALEEKTDPPAPTTLFIPAIINSPGGEGSFWRTDVWIYNPGQESLTVTAEYTPAVGAPFAREIVVSPRGQTELANIVETLFGTTGIGTLSLSAAGPIAGVSRTFNTPPSGAGTFGFSIAAMDVASTLGSAVLNGVSHNTAYRTNIGMMNPHDHEVTVRARLYSSAGVLLGEATRALAAGTVQQPSITDLFQAAGAVSGGYVVVDSTQGSFFSYASVVDNRSNDPTLVLPTADRPK